MYETKLAAVYILFATSVCVRCTYMYWQKIWPLDDYDGDTDDEYRGFIPRYNHDVLARNCDTEYTNTLAEIKSDIQNLQQLVVGLRGKVDPDFKLPSPRVEVMSLDSVHSQPVPPSGISTSSAESKCPPGFQYVDRARSCYKFVFEEHNWTSAGQRCHDFHPESHLAVITSSEENIGLMAYLRPQVAKNRYRVGTRNRSWSEYTLLWTSGQRLNETSCTDEFVWKMANSTQLPLSFTYWDQNEPNCHKNQPEGCLQLKTFVGFKWNDAPCDEGSFPLCEYDPM